MFDLKPFKDVAETQNDVKLLSRSAAQLEECGVGDVMRAGRLRQILFLDLLTSRLHFSFLVIGIDMLSVSWYNCSHCELAGENVLVRQQALQCQK